MITRLFLIVLSIVLSGQSLEGWVEENTIEKTHGIEVVYEELISTAEAKKQSRKVSKHPITFLSNGRKSIHFVKTTIPQTQLYVQNRSLRI